MLAHRGSRPPAPAPQRPAVSSRRATCLHAALQPGRRDLLLSTTASVALSLEHQAVASEQPQQAGEPEPAPEPAGQAATSPQQATAQAQAGQRAGGDVEGGVSSSSTRKPPKGGKRRKQQATTQRADAPRPPGVVPRVRLGSSLDVSRVIRGCWQLDGQHRGDPVSDRTGGIGAIEDLDAFCKAGVFTLDTSDNYGPSEAIIGQHLRLNPGAALRTKVLTKLSFMAPPGAGDLRKDAIEYRVRSSIARLGLTRADMVQLHWEPPSQAAAGGGGAKGRSKARQPEPGFVSAARALQRLQEEGVVGEVGVSNFDVPMLLALLDAGITPASNQVAYSVVDRRPALFLARFCEARRIPLLAYGTLAGGFLADRYLDTPADKARIDTVSKARYGMLLRQLGGWAFLQDMLRVCHEVAEKHGVSASCVAGRWVLQQPGVAAIVQGARNASHLRDSQRLFSPGFELDEADLLDLDAAYEGAHQPSSDVYAWERGGEW